MSWSPNTSASSRLELSATAPGRNISVKYESITFWLRTCVTMNSRFELNPGTKLALMKSLPSSSSAPDNFTLLWSYGRMLVNLRKEVVFEVLKQYFQEKPVFRTIHGQICCSTKLVSAHMLKLLVLLAEPEVAVCGHDTVVFGEIFQLDGSWCFNNRVWQTNLKSKWSWFEGYQPYN